MLTKTLFFLCRLSSRGPRKRTLVKVFVVLAAAAATCYGLLQWSSEDAGYTNSKGKLMLPRYLALRARQAEPAGCRMPELDPFSEEIMRSRRNLPPVVCKGNNWVECYKNECFVKDDILNEMDNVTCVYRDILFKNDYEITKGAPVTAAHGERYELVQSNHVEVNCMGKRKNSWNPLASLLGSSWRGHASGLRALPAGSQLSARGTVNVAMIVLDSTSHGGFVREMPKSHQCLRELGAVVLNSYNIVGDGTAHALFPILTGRNPLELNGTQRKTERNKGNLTVDPKDFIFHHFKDIGYRTAYLEDYPKSGTFQGHYSGFKYQPVDDYLRPFTLEEQNFYCAGSVPKYRLLIDLADQYTQMADQYFLLTVTSLAHDDEELLSTIDDEFASFLQQLKSKGRLNNTMLFVMGDHGPRFQGRRNTFQGRLEERLPFVSIVLPETLRKSRPDALDSVKANADVLTTPYDLHTTMLDAVGLAERANQYKVPNSDLTRGLSLLKRIPRRRQCGAAGVAAHYCACAAWRALPARDARSARAAAHLAAHVARLTAHIRSLCVERTLTSVEWVQQLDASDQLLKNNDLLPLSCRVYQVKITMGPLAAEFEGTVVYDEAKRQFSVDTDHISRVNKYNDEPHCILTTHLELHKFCLCKDILSTRKTERKKVLF